MIHALSNIPYMYLMCQAYTYTEVYRNDFTSVDCGNLDCEPCDYVDPAGTFYGVAVEYCLVGSDPGAGIVGDHKWMINKFLGYMYDFII